MWLHTKDEWGKQISVNLRFTETIIPKQFEVDEAGDRQCICNGTLLYQCDESEIMVQESYDNVIGKLMEWESGSIDPSAPT